MLFPILLALATTAGARVVAPPSAVPKSIERALHKDDLPAVRKYVERAPASADEVLVLGGKHGAAACRDARAGRLAAWRY